MDRRYTLGLMPSNINPYVCKSLIQYRLNDRSRFNELGGVHTIKIKMATGVF